MMKINLMKTLPVLGFSLLALLSACSSESNPLPSSETDNNISVSAPRFITQARIAPSDLDLTLVANGQDVATERNEDNEWTGQIEVPIGETVSVSVLWSTAEIDLATLEKEIPAVTTNRMEVISSDEYTILDNDMDGASNIEEIDAVPPTDINDPDSFPSVVPVVEDVAELTNVNPTSLELSAQIPGSTEGSLSFANTGNAVLDFTVRSDQSFLTVNPASGSVTAGDSQTVTVTASCDTMAASRSGTLTIGSNGGDSTVSVTVECTDAPVLPMAILSTVSPAVLDLDAQVGDSTDGSISFSNNGDADLEYSISSDQSWLTASPISGSLTSGQTQSVTVTATCDSVAPERTGLISISGNGGDRSVSVSSECSALPMPVLGNVDPESLSLTGELGEFTDTGTISFENVGNALMNFTATATAESDELISADPASGTVAAGESQSIVVSGSCGASEGSFTFGLTLAGNFEPSQEIPVTTVCSPAPVDGPDLIVSELSVTEVDPITFNISYSFTVQNIGDVDALLDGVSVQAFLSQDEVFANSGDIPAGGRILSAAPGSMLPPGGEMQDTFQSTTVENPENFDFLTVKVDFNEALTESDETNNTNATQIPLAELPIMTPAALTGDSNR